MIDQHFPDPENTAFFPGEEFLALAKHNFNPLGKYDNAGPGIDINEPFMIPYRCLYSANIPNLFMAGRNISTSRIALAALQHTGDYGHDGRGRGSGFRVVCPARMRAAGCL